MAEIYALLLFIAMSIIFSCFIRSFEAPFKIKIISLTALFFLTLRYISLLLCFFSKSILWLYSLKYIYFLYILVIPIIIMVVLYTILRNNTISFNYIMITSVVCYILYPILITMNSEVFSIEIFSNPNLGYHILHDNSYISVFYGAVNLLALLYILIVLNDNHNIIAVMLGTSASLISIVETVAVIIKIQVFPQYLLGEIFWLITFNYMLYKLKRR